MPYYENVFLVRPDVSAQQVETLTQSFAETLSTRGGTVAKTEHWGLRNLAYRIKKNRKAHYVLMNLDAPPPAIQEMERTMRLSEDVLRSLTVRVDSLEEGPSAMVRNKGRDERPRRGRDGDGGDSRRARSFSPASGTPVNGGNRAEAGEPGKPAEAEKAAEGEE